MKTIFSLPKTTLLFFSLIVLLGSFKNSSLQPRIEFEETEFNFGTMAENSDVSHVFVFTNKGTSPLIVSDVVKTCGCTTPEWTEKPVAPGQKGFITLRFDSKRIGVFNKGVTVKCNDPENPVITLKISGTIEAKSGTAPLKPENKSIPKE